MTSLELLKVATDYIGNGFSVLPCGRDKRPLLSTWVEFQGRLPTTTELSEWAKTNPNANVALVCGRLSDLTVVDCDTAEAITTVEALIPDTLTVPVTTTPRGGRHYHFRFTPGLVSRTATKDIDVKTEGGIVVDAGRTDKGAYTRNSTLLVNRPVMPRALLEFLKKGQGASSSEHKLTGGDWTTDIHEGNRDAEMTRRAGKLLQIGIPTDEVLDLLLSINDRRCKPPLPDAQIRKIVASITAREAAKPDGIEKKKFKTVTTREMLRRYGGNEIRWTVEGWLPEASCGLVVAPPGSYKTWILTSLAFAVATGRPFLGHYPVVGKGPVLVIQQEDPFWMLLGRMAKMFNSEAPTEKKTEGNVEHGLDCRFVAEFDTLQVYWHEERELNLEDKNCMARVEEKIAELKPVLVTIDPLYSGISAKDYMVMGAQAMLSLKRLRDKFKTSFALAHHTTVAGSSSEDRASIWGSQFLNAWLEWGWRIPDGDEKGNIVIRHFKSCENPKRIRLRFKITDWNFGVEIDENCPEDAVKRIEEAILNGGRFNSMEAIQGIAGCGRAQAYRMVKKMGLKKNEEGYFKVPFK